MARSALVRFGVLLLFVAALGGLQRPAAHAQSAAYPPLETARVLLADTYVGDERPGTVVYGVESIEPTWDNVLYEIQVQGDTGFVTYHIYPSAALATDNPIFGLGSSFESDDYPFHSFAIVLSSGWSDYAFACALEANVLVCGASSPSYLDLNGYTPSLADGAAVVNAEGGLAHLLRAGR